MLGPVCWSLTVPLLLGAVQEPAGWTTHTSKDGGFSISLPRAPTESKQRVKTATGQLDVVLLVAEGKNGAAYVVSYSDFPPAEVKPGTENKRLDFARDGAVASARGRLLSEKRIEVEGHPAREVVIAGKGETVVRQRLVAVGARLYQIMAVGPAGATSSKEAGAFLDSFRLVK